MRARHKKWTLPYIEAHPEIVSKSLTDCPFSLKGETLYLEIGIGKGDFILGMSKKQEGFYLGIEKVPDVIAVAAKKCLESESENVYLLYLDFDEAYPLLEGYCFKSIYLNFSDPWPKKKHHRRRLSAKERLLKMKSLLEDDGRFIIKTDNDDLFEYTKLEAIEAGLTIVEENKDYALEESDVMTEYEANFRAQGIPIKRLILSK